MTILVTGGAGYIGSHMVYSLIDSNHDVEVLDDLSTGFDWAVPPDVKLHQGCVGNRELLDQIFQNNTIEAVIHFAASIVVPESVANPIKYYQNNTANALTLIDACVDYNVKKFIFSSTAAVYGIPTSIPVKEDFLLEPISPYGMSKVMTERILSDVSKVSELNFVSLRYFNVAGADPQLRTGQSTKNATTLVKIACEAATGKRDKLSLFGTDFQTPDGTCIRDYIHVYDLISAHEKALELLDHGGKSAIYNCGYGKGFSVREVIDSVKKISGNNFQVIEENRRPGDMAEMVADSTLIQTELNWQPLHNSLDEIVTHALEWEKNGKFTPTP